jgi:isopenicillin-N epimerase
MVLVSHVINLTGQIMPVREVAALGRRRNIPVVVDGAHALAHLDYKFSDLDCDYYGSSLHKWLCAPIGTGLLYVRRDRIAGLWPLMAAEQKQDADIRKFEEIGTHPAANYLAIAEALTFHQGIGPARKLARLLYLRDYWADRLVRHERVRLHTSRKPGCASGLCTFEIVGVDPAKLVEWLWKEHRIFTTAIMHDEFKGVRVSPSVYTQLPELDRFCEKTELVIKDGLPA